MLSISRQTEIQLWDRVTPLKRILTTAVLMGLVATEAWSQAPPIGSLTVNTTPPGAAVMLEGEAEVAGISPVTFVYPLIGEYHLTITKHGYENYRTRLVLDPSNPLQLDIDLSPRTAVKAAARSVFVPGWGQFYTEQKTKGFAFGLFFAGAVLAFLNVDEDFKSKEDVYRQRLADYDAALTAGGSYDLLSVRHRALLAAQEEAYDAENDRRVAVGAVIGIWGLNLLDALLFTPEQRATFSIKGLSVAPSANDAGFGLTLTKAF